MIRRAVVSGTFYPSRADKLEDFITNCIPEAIELKTTQAAILPHAGYIYSGKVAIQTAAQIRPKDRLIILGPNHTGLGAPFSVFARGSWQTPLGPVDIDGPIAEKIIEKGILQEDAEAHRHEHSIEVQLPIFQTLFKQFRFIPITCMVAERSLYRQIAEIIHSAIRQNLKISDFLLVASSDMTHYEPKETAEKKDAYVIEAILNLDTDGLLKRIRQKNVSMCGVAPVGILLEILRALGTKNGRLVTYATSGDINKDYSSVVGYAGILFDQKGDL